MATGQVCITGAVLPQFPKATCPSGYFYSQYNGWEPRFGLTYRAAKRTVVHTAVVILDDHNNTLVQENQNIRLSWPRCGTADPQQFGYWIAGQRLLARPAGCSIVSRVEQPVWS